MSWNRIGAKGEGMRGRREQSEADIYHVVERGTGRQLIFEDDADRQSFLSILAKNLAEDEVELFAWCLMGNHVHLLMHAPIERIADCMRKTCSSYALRFNRRHGRTGHLFQERYRSEPVDDDCYLAAVVRYIHQNPEKAGLAGTGEWKWSSYGQYIGVGRTPEICSIGFVLDCFGGVAPFRESHGELCSEARCIDVFEGRSATRAMPDEEALIIAADVLGDGGIEEIKSWAKDRRDEGLASLKEAGLTVRQIERLTGIGRNVIARSK